MSETSAYCPRCGKVVNFLKRGGVAACPVCGFEYQLNDASRSIQPVSALPGWSVFKTVLIVFLIMLAAGTIILAVVFVGCVHALGNI